MTDTIEPVDHFRKLHADAEVDKARALLEAAMARQALVHKDMQVKYQMGSSDTYDGSTLAITRDAASPSVFK